MRPVLRPGTRLLRRDRDHLQLGVEPGHAVVLRDSSTVQALLRQLDGAQAREQLLDRTDDPRTAAETLDALVAAGAVIDADELRATPASDELTHLLCGRDSATAQRLVRTRRASTVALAAAGAGPSAVDVLTRAGALLTASGVGCLVTDTAVADRIPSGGWRHALPGPGTAPDVVLLAGSPVTGPAAESLVAAGTAHLALSLVDGVAVVGPLVRPGRSACVGCVDRARAIRDPAWPALVHQLRPQPGPVPPSDLPGPRSRVLESAAVTWAVRDLLAHLVGDPVLTDGASLRIGADLLDQVLHRWELDPGCACCLLS